MPRHEVAGTVLDVDVELPELVAAADGVAPSWTVRRADAARPSGELTTITELRTTTGVLWGTIAAGPDRYRLTFPGHATFDVDLTRRHVTYAAEAATSPVTLRHLLIDQVLPYLLVADGAFVLHASCVAVGGRGIAFVGPTGVGKSSLAASFVERGGTLLADDFVVLTDDGGDYVVTPAYPGLRLWEDSATRFAGAGADLPRVAAYTDKRRWAVPAATSGDGRVPLAAVVAPGSQPAPGQPPCRIGRLGGADAFAVVCEQGFRLERSGRARQAADLERVARLVERVPVHLVEYRRDYALLPEVQAAILGAVAGG